MSFIVTPEDLKNRLENNLDDTIIIDARFWLNQPKEGKKVYLESHIPYAAYLDLDKDLSGKPEKHGGKRPLPDVDAFAKKLGEIGIDHDKTVVIYDQEKGSIASRAWWVLHYMGHEKVYILEGGFKGWMEAENDVTDEVITRESTIFEPKVLKDAVVNIEDVKERNSSTVLIDSRSKDRYLGKNETMYAKAGHIPGAKNFFWKDVLNADGSWKDVEQIKNTFSSLSKKDEIIVSCGSGVSACPNVVALKMAGYENVKLYPGSLSDWISYEQNEVETKEE